MGGNGATVDLTPGTAGSVGQVIDMDHEVGASGPIADDIVDYLEQLAAALDKYQIVDGEQVEEIEAAVKVRLFRATDDGREVRFVARSDTALIERLTDEGWTADEEFAHHLARLVFG